TPHVFTPQPVKMGGAGLAVTIPRLAGMSSIQVDRASLTLTGGSVDLPEVVLAAPASTQAQRLALPAGVSGALRRVRIEGLTLANDAAAGSPIAGQVALRNDSATGPDAFIWTFGGQVTFSSGGASGDKRLHFVFFPLI